MEAYCTACGTERALDRERDGELYLTCDHRGYEADCATDVIVDYGDLRGLTRQLSVLCQDDEHEWCVRVIGLESDIQTVADAMLAAANDVTVGSELVVRLRYEWRRS